MRLRLLLAVLIVANLGFLGYQMLSPDPRTDAGTRIAELQINPGRIRIQGVATRGPGSGTATARTGPYRACLEWGPFAASDIAKAESALAKLALAQPALQRPVDDAGSAKRFSYFVREPDAATVAQIADFQRAFTGTTIKAGPCPS